MSKEKALEILLKIENEQGEIPFSVRLTTTEREQLGHLAKIYKRPMGDVIRFLLHAAIVDYYQEGEVIALSKY